MKLKKYLETKGLTQERFAYEANLTRQTIINLLNGKSPSFSTMTKIRKATGGQVSFKDWSEK